MEAIVSIPCLLSLLNGQTDAELDTSRYSLDRSLKQLPSRYSRNDKSTVGNQEPGNRSISMSVPSFHGEEACMDYLPLCCHRVQVSCWVSNSKVVRRIKQLESTLYSSLLSTSITICIRSTNLSTTNIIPAAGHDWRLCQLIPIKWKRNKTPQLRRVHFKNFEVYWYCNRIVSFLIFTVLYL